MSRLEILRIGQHLEVLKEMRRVGTNGAEQDALATGIRLMERELACRNCDGTGKISRSFNGRSDCSFPDVEETCCSCKGSRRRAP